MIADVKTHIETALVAAGFNARKIVTTGDSAFESDKDLRPPGAVYGIKIQEFNNLNHSGKVVNTTLRVMIMIVEKTQPEAINKILNVHEQLHDSHIAFSDSRFEMEGTFAIAETPQALEINRKEATYAIEYDAPVTVRL